MGLQIPQNINAKKIIDDASVLGIGVLSESDENSIFAAQSEISNAQKEVKKANSDIENANKKSDDANSKKAEADQQTADGNSKKDGSVNEGSVSEKRNDANSIGTAAKQNSSKMSQSQASLTSGQAQVEAGFQSQQASLESTNSRIQDLINQNNQLSAENQALMDGLQLDVDASFDGTGSGVKSAYSLSTATEVEEEAQKNPVDPNAKVAESPNNSKFDANVDAMSANESEISQLEGQAQAEKTSADAKVQEADAKAQNENQAAQGVKSESEQDNSTIATIESYAKDGIQVGNVLDVSGSVLSATGVALTTAGTLTATAGAATSATGIAVTSIGAGVTALGAPLCALFGIGVPIVGAGGTTTAGGGVTTATGGTITGIGGTLVTAGNGTQAVGKGLTVTGKGLKVAGNAVLTGTNIAKGDIVGAIGSATSTVATAAAFTKTANIGSKAVSQKVYDIASATKDGMNSAKHFVKGEYAEGFVDAFSAASFGSGAVGDFTSGKVNKYAEVGNSVFASLSSTTAAGIDYAKGDTTNALFDLAGAVTAGSSAHHKVNDNAYANKEDNFYCTVNKVQSVYNRFFASDEPVEQVAPQIAGNDLVEPKKPLNDSYICQNDAIPQKTQIPTALSMQQEVDAEALLKRDTKNV